MSQTFNIYHQLHYKNIAHDTLSFPLVSTGTKQKRKQEENKKTQPRLFRHQSKSNLKVRCLKHVLARVQRNTQTV